MSKFRPRQNLRLEEGFGGIDLDFDDAPGVGTVIEIEASDDLPDDLVAIYAAPRAPRFSICA